MLNMIKCKGISVNIGTKAILSSVSFKANYGEITTILGRNGSGKTTLLSSILRECKYSGDVIIDGISTKEMTKKQLARKISLMPQVLPSPSISVESLVAFGREPYTAFSSALSKGDRDIVTRAIGEMHLSEIAQRNIDTLSGGERQRAYFAMLLAQDADVIMTDEPTTYLDAPAKSELLAFLSRQKECGKAVITVLHDLGDAVRVSDRVILIDGGRVIFSGTPSEFAFSSYPKEIFGLEAIRFIDEGKEYIFFK